MSFIKGFSYVTSLNEAIPHARELVKDGKCIYDAAHEAASTIYPEPDIFWVKLLEDILHALGVPKEVSIDLAGDPYRNGDIGPWKVSFCCFAYAKGTEEGIVCRTCHEPASHFDTPAELETSGDRFGRAP